MDNNSVSLSFFLKKWRVILAFVLAGFFVGFSIASFFSKPVHVYTRLCSVRNNEVYSNDENSRSSTVNDTEVSRFLVGQYSVALSQSEFLSPMAEYMNENSDLDQKISVGTLKSSISVEQLEDYGLMRIVVSNENKYLSEKISNAVDVYLLPKVSNDLGYAEITPQGERLDSVIKTSPVTSGIVSALIGAVLAVLLILASAFFNNKISDEEDLVQKYSIPVLGVIPDPTAKQKGANNNAK